MLPVMDLHTQIDEWMTAYFRAKRLHAPNDSYLWHLGLFYPNQSYDSLRNTASKIDRGIIKIKPKLLVHLASYYGESPIDIERQCLKELYEAYASDH